METTTQDNEKQFLPLEVLLCKNQVFIKIENDWQRLKEKQDFFLPSEFQNIIIFQVSDIQKLTNEKKASFKQYSTKKLVRVIHSNDALFFYEAHKSLPWKINKVTGIVQKQAAYSESDLIYLNNLYGINSEVHAQKTNIKRSRVRTCANTKLSTLKK